MILRKTVLKYDLIENQAYSYYVTQRILSIIQQDVSFFR